MWECHTQLSPVRGVASGTSGALRTAMSNPVQKRLWISLVMAGLSTSRAAGAAPSFSVPDAEIARDERGAKLYMVDLDDAATFAYPSTFTAAPRFAPYHSGQSVNLVKAIEAQYGFQVRQMTSVTHLSFTAALTDAQLTALDADPRVTGIAPDIVLYPSTPPNDTTAVWRDSINTTAEPPYTQWKLTIPTPPAMQTWGIRAVNTSTPAVIANGPVVYLLDAGVGQHTGLTSVVERVNGVVPAGNDCGARVGTTCTPAQLANTVGCYTHSTMVAGTVGATNAGGGTRGVYPGVSIVSVSLYRPDTGAHTCLSGANSSASDFAQALDWIGHNILTTNHTGRPSVVSMSFNWSFTSQAPPGLFAEIQSVTHQTPGAFFVQSAGNFYKDACQSAYGPAVSNDGVMVVGAINGHGQPVRPLNGLPGFWKDVDGPLHQSGSNYGSCVEAWAPGDAVLTTVAGNITSQQGTTVYSDYAYVSGTSLSAPHVAGLAAALIASDATLTTPALVEARVRARFKTLGSHDAAGLALNMPSLNAAERNKPLNTPYAEMWVSQYCYYPYFAGPFPGCTYLPELGPTERPYLVRDYETLFRRPTPAPLLSFDSKGEGAYTCDVVFTDTGFESHVVAAGSKQYFLGIDAAALGSSLPGTLSSTLCPSALVRLATN